MKSKIIVKMKNLGNGKFKDESEYFVEGVKVTKKQFDKANRTKQHGQVGAPMLSGNGSGWPLKMESLAVHPSQIKDAMERNRKAGLHVEYDRSGTPIVPDRGTRRRLMALENTVIEGGVRDRSGGYGDDINTEKPPPRKKKLSQAFLDAGGAQLQTAEFVKATRKKFFGKE